MRNEEARIHPRLNLRRGRGIPLRYRHGARSVSVSDIIGGASIGLSYLRALGGEYGSRIRGGGVLHYIYMRGRRTGSKFIYGVSV
jgi:hypothetical protein